MPETTISSEVRDFLLTGTRTAKLATVRADGRPHVVPVWFVLDGDHVIFNTGGASVKGANLQRDPRLAICVDDEAPPFAFAMIEGVVAFSEQPDELLYWATRIAGRYMGAEKAEAYGKRNGVPGELLGRVKVTRVTFQKNVAD